MSDFIATLNVGSSSVKAALYAVDRGALVQCPAFRGEATDLGKPAGRTVDEAIDALLAAVDDKIAGGAVIAVGHRIVHGGADFAAPAVVDETVLARLDALIPLAPGHQPHNLAGVRAARRRFPAAAQVASFDTAFHRTQPRIAQLFALPRQYAEEGIVRYGFHGLSYAYIVEAAAGVMQAPLPERTIVAHLGAGASLCAIRGGRSVATTMGFTALDGLPMATRCGALDPGVLLYLLEHKGETPAALSQKLYRESGLLGLSGISADMRVLEASDDPRADEAVGVFIYRVTEGIGAMAAALGGVDALVFTAGVGENSASVRRKILEGCRWLGFDPDETANDQGGPRLTREGPGPSAWAMATNEELMLARGALVALRVTHS